MLKKIAVIHFGGPDQLIFAAPAVIGLKQRNPGAHLTMFVDTSAKDILRGWEIIDSAYPVDTQKLIEFSKNNVSRSVTEILDTHILPRTEKFDLVINLSNEPIATLLCTYLNGSEKTGAFFNNESETQINGAWSQYQSAVVGRTILNPFHLADLYKYICRSQAEPSGIDIFPYESEIQEVKEFTKDAPGIKIGLILSHQWPLANSVAYAEEVLAGSPKATIYLLPSSPDDTNTQNLARKILESIARPEDRARIVDKLSTTRLPLLHALVNDMHLVVGPLSMTTHLATACGTFTITFAFLDQHLFEQGPYGHGHIIIADENQDASELSIPWVLASEMTRFAITANGTKVPSLEQWENYCTLIAADVSPQFKIYATTRVSFHQQDGTERVDMIYHPILSKGATLQECLFAFFRLIWQFDLNGSEDTIEEITISRTSTISGLINLVDALEKLHKIAIFGSTYSRYVSDDLRKNDINLARQDSEKLQDIDNLISKMGSEVPAVAPLCNFYTISQFQNRDADPIKISDMARLCYERLQVQISIVLDLVQELVSKGKSSEKAPDIQTRAKEADAT